jgi:hypothetical protein
MVEDKLKRFIVNVTEKQHAELIICLKDDDFKSQSQFFRDIIEAYTNKDPLLLNFIDDLKVKRNARNKKRNKLNRKLLKDGQELMKDLALNKEEIENIFDILEENNIDV